MEKLTDDDLRRLTVTLATALRATTGWHEPPRLYGLLPVVSRRRAFVVVSAGGRRWLRLAEGDPYSFLDAVRVRETDVSALALSACGWAFPPEHPEQWHGRPSTHPRRVRMRTLVVVTSDRRQCAALERRDTGLVSVDDQGEGPMLRALWSAWATDEVAGPPPAA